MDDTPIQIFIRMAGGGAARSSIQLAALDFAGVIPVPGDQIFAIPAPGEPPPKPGDFSHPRKMWTVVSRVFGFDPERKTIGLLVTEGPAPTMM
jgi:hypothetical protein